MQKFQSNETRSNLSQNYICHVCGDKAHVINYGALSCSSCKTFFRRHGFCSQVEIFIFYFVCQRIYVHLAKFSLSFRWKMFGYNRNKKILYGMSFREMFINWNELGSHPERRLVVQKSPNAFNEIQFNDEKDHRTYSPVFQLTFLWLETYVEIKYYDIYSVNCTKMHGFEFLRDLWVCQLGIFLWKHMKQILGELDVSINFSPKFFFSISCRLWCLGLIGFSLLVLNFPVPTLIDNSYPRNSLDASALCQVHFILRNTIEGRDHIR